MLYCLITPEGLDFSQIQRTLRYAEWAVLGVAAIVVPINGANFSTPLEFVLLFTTLAICAALSCVFPINRPLWQRRMYVGLGLLAIIPTRLTGWNLELLLYLYLVKSCFLLRRREAILTALIMAVVWQLSLVLGFSWQWSVTVKMVRANMDSYLNHPYQVLVAQLLNDTGAYIASSLFVILFSFVVIAERKSRHQAETLATQVEALSVALERSRIAREIHDSLGHSLTNLDSQLAVIQQRLHQNYFDRTDQDEVRQAVETAQFLSNQCIEDVSRSLQAIRHSEELDLNHALLSLIEPIRQNSSINIRWEIHLPSLPSPTGYHIYSIVKEGLINIHKHAQASQIRLHCRSTAEEVVIELEDNGRGFDPEVVSAGFGLRGIAERVHLLGGRLTINSSPGSGTCIHITIPL